MSLIAIIFAATAGIIHVFFFLMESVFWLNPRVHSIFSVENLDDAETLRVYLKNQGYYNLFLALGIFFGIVLTRIHFVAGQTLVVYVCIVMISAALVLRHTMPALALGAYAQGIAPACALMAIFFGLRNNI